MDAVTKKQLQIKACTVRMGVIEGVFNAKSGHPGGSLSVADILTYLYFDHMNVDPKNPKDENRDRFVLSKGHTAPPHPVSALATLSASPRRSSSAARVRSSGCG